MNALARLGHSRRLWRVSAPLMGLTIGPFATRPHAPDHRRDGELRIGVGSSAVIAWPLRNKPVLLALGTSAALIVFAPIQPFLGALSLLFGATTPGLRLRQIARGCGHCPAVGSSEA